MSNNLKINAIDMQMCRICSSHKQPLIPLFKYQLSGNYAEMLTAIADVKVASNDGLPDRICQKCCTSLEKAYLLKTVAERTDKKLRKLVQRVKDTAPSKKIVFDSFVDIKSEFGDLAIKSEPKWEMEIEVLDTSVTTKPAATDSESGKDIVIANTIIKKVEKDDEKPDLKKDEKIDLTWTSSKPDGNNYDNTEYLDDDFFQDDDDDDYLPPMEKTKTKSFKKPKLNEIKVYKDKSPTKKLKIVNKGKKPGDDVIKSPTVTCYRIMKNGAKGPPIILKRPKDATILKIHPNYKIKTDTEKPPRQSKPIRLIRTASKPQKTREKLVCPVCGILTYTLANHISTHQEKKKYNCSLCSKTFGQKGNLMTHMKQHSGIKDHICEVCGAGFYSQKSLIRHNLIHKGDRPYPCNLCSKRFIARCDLNRHLRIHSGYKPYKCATCTMSFNAKHQLQNHERMHTGERPYTCQICNVAFSYKVNLNNHVYKVHGINLKFKSIHTVTEEVIRREASMVNETRLAITHIMPALGDVPTPAAHETVHNTDYAV